MTTRGTTGPTPSPRSRPTPGAAWALALLMSMVAGVVLASEPFVAWPLPVLVGAGALFGGALVTLGALAFHDHRAGGHGFWAALGQGSRTSLRALWELLP